METVPLCPNYPPVHDGKRGLPFIREGVVVLSFPDTYVVNVIPLFLPLWTADGGPS